MGMEMLKHWLGSVTGVACYGCSQVWVREVPGSNPGVTPIFEGVSFK